VFVRATEDLTIMIGEESDPVVLSIGDVAVLQYFSVQEYVLADRILLI
jgi:DNA replication complex GINS protein SLD5 C-terminus